MSDPEGPRHTRELDGLRMVITGGGRGIGAATAELAARQGAHVLIADVLDDDGHETVRRIGARGGRIAFQHCDVGDADQVEELMRVAAATLGGIDVLHNNAGVHESMLSGDIAIETMAQETWDRVLAVNLRGPWLCARAALPFLRESGRASIINSGSTASLVGYPNQLAYGCSKAGVAILTMNLAVALAPYGIRVNCYCPGSTQTAMPAAYRAAMGPAPTNAASTHLVYRMAEPREIAEVVCFLASSRSSFVNGAVWVVDGGSLAWRGTVDQLPPPVEHHVVPRGAGGPGHGGAQ